MANLQVRRFVPSDYLALAGEVTGPRAPAFTALIDGELAACAGIDLFEWTSVGSAWAFLGPLGRHHGARISRAVVRGLAGIVRDYGLVRVEADCLAAFPAAHRWLTWRKMGFQLEGTMLKRGPHGETMLRYVLFPQGAP